jgi:Rrf2 family iron-sulfur cluster assembly transcriptional regulator
MTHELWSNLNVKMLEYLSSVSLADLVNQQRNRPITIRSEPVSIFREHRAALELPTSTLQSIDLNGLRPV